jgi:pyruvate,orthophosphate dikinase
MQARAIFEAVAIVAKKGIKVIPEVMIPLVGDAKELEHQKAIVNASPTKFWRKPASKSSTT